MFLMFVAWTRTGHANALFFTFVFVLITVRMLLVHIAWAGTRHAGIFCVFVVHIDCVING